MMPFGEHERLFATPEYTTSQSGQQVETLSDLPGSRARLSLECPSRQVSVSSVTYDSNEKQRHEVALRAAIRANTSRVWAAASRASGIDLGISQYKGDGVTARQCP
jgi:hypothetical protein